MRAGRLFVHVGRGDLALSGALADQSHHVVYAAYWFLLHWLRIHSSLLIFMDLDLVVVIFGVQKVKDCFIVDFKVRTCHFHLYRLHSWMGLEGGSCGSSARLPKGVFTASSALDPVDLLKQVFKASWK